MTSPWGVSGRWRFLGLFGLTLPLALPAQPAAPVFLEAPATPSAPLPPVAGPAAPFAGTPKIRLGIDVLEAERFAPLQGLTLGLLTHPAGVDGRGVSTIEILRRAPGVHLAALFAAEHGLYGEFARGVPYPDHRDTRTGLPIRSLYNGVNNKPSAAQLRGLDAVVIDLQDIGSRSYTFVSAMKLCLEGCFEHGVEVIVLDRPNPLGGLKVDGPPLDPQWTSYVGQFRVPYVHGLTIGELARMAQAAPGILKIPEAARHRGRLRVVAMEGWHRRMLWPDTGLRWVPTSPFMPDFAAVEGYPMTGLGTERSGFKNGIGSTQPFRGLSFHGIRPETLQHDLQAFQIPGVAFTVTSQPDPKTHQALTGLYVGITDWDRLRPTELSAYLMKLSCRYNRANPFAGMTPTEVRSLLIYWGSTAFYQELAAKGAQADVAGMVLDWEKRAAIYQRESRKYWLYN